ncbi:MAG: ribosome silencing factor [Sulfuritalea sp.]|nr:ribosome silencing factor [Sulfuritalea sp.]
MDIKKLQALVIDALEDIKAQEIRLYDTTHLTSMFDRIAIASGTSNRQTKALAASVRDKVKEAGGHIVGIEGEGTGEWVLVDLGDMIVHIMQPAIRAYYRLEEIWGDKEVKFGAAKRLSSGASPSLVKGHLVGSKPAPAAKAAAKKVPAEKATTEKVTRTASKPIRKPVAQVATNTPTRTAAKSATKTASKTPAKTASKTARKTAAKSVVKKVPIKKIVGKTASKTASKKAPAKRASPPAKKAAKKSASR